MSIWIETTEKLHKNVGIWELEKEDKISSIIQMDDIIKRLDRIEKILIEQQKLQKKLNDHIVFVEETYKVVRSPCREC